MSTHKQHLEIIITLNKLGLEEKVNDYQNWFKKWNINWTWQLDRSCRRGLGYY